MLFSGLPPVVREQDEYSAMFTLRNATAAAADREVHVGACATSPLTTSRARRSRAASRRSRSPAAKRKSCRVPIKTPIGVERLYWEVTAAGSDGQDRLRTSQKVIAVHPVRVYQATLARSTSRSSSRSSGLPTRCPAAAACAST